MITLKKTIRTGEVSQTWEASAETLDEAKEALFYLMKMDVCPSLKVESND